MSPKEIGLYGRSVIDTADRIANGARGSGDPVEEEAVEWLRWRTSPDVWVRRHGLTPYDAAVLNLAREALLLHDSRNS